MNTHWLHDLPPRPPVAHVWVGYRGDYLDSACGRIVRHRSIAVLEPLGLVLGDGRYTMCPHCPLGPDRYVIR